MLFGLVPLEEPGGWGHLFTNSLQLLVGDSSWRVFILRHLYLSCMQGEQIPANSNTLGQLAFSPAKSTKVRLQRYELGAPEVSATTPRFSSPSAASLLTSRPKFPTQDGHLCWTFLDFSNPVSPYQTSHLTLSQTRIPTPVVISSSSHIPSIMPRME